MNGKINQPLERKLNIENLILLVMKMFSKISKISVDKYTSMTYNKIIKGKEGTAGKV